MAMERMHHPRIDTVCVYAAGYLAITLAAYSSAQTIDQRVPANRRIALAAHTRLGAALQLVERATDRSFVCEAPLDDRSAAGVVNGIEKDADAALSGSYGLFALHRAHVTAFRTRYLTHDQDCNLEVPEFQNICSEIHRLIRSQLPYNIDLSTITDRKTMLSSLSAQQIAQIGGGGLSFRELSQNQQQLWFKINHTQAYSALNQDFERAESVFLHWSNCRLIRSKKADGPSSLVFMPPTLTGMARGEAVELGPPIEVGSAIQEAGPAQVELDPAPIKLFDEGLSKKLPEVSGAVSLTTLTNLIQSTSDIEVVAPGYARNRTVIVALRNATSADLLMSLCDIYGWQVWHEKGRRYRIGRPRLDPPRDAVDLHAKIRASLSPEIHLLWNKEASRNAPRRFDRRLSLINQGAVRTAGADWHDVAVRQLEESEQRALASAVFERLVKNRMARYIYQSEAPLWISKPELGVFSIDRSRNLHGHPLFVFSVQGASMKKDGWGWFVGTNSLK